MAHAAKPAAAGAHMRQQYRLDPVAEGQIGVADDAGRDPGLAVIARGAHRGDAGDELGLADRPHLGGAVRAVHRMAFDEHGGDDVVAAVEVGQQFVEQIAVPAAQPQMMVRVDDRQIGIEDRLRRGRGEPCLVRRDRCGRTARRCGAVSSCGNSDARSHREAYGGSPLLTSAPARFCASLPTRQVLVAAPRAGRNAARYKAFSSAFNRTTPYGPGAEAVAGVLAPPDLSNTTPTPDATASSSNDGDRKPAPAR